MLTLSLINKWFEMTKALVKTEDYREINSYWCNRLLLMKGKPMSRSEWDYLLDIGYDNIKDFMDNIISLGATFKKFKTNKMKLGYPKSTDSERILKLEHKGIEIRTGNPEWGAEPNKLHFVIKHGLIIK